MVKRGRGRPLKDPPTLDKAVDLCVRLGRTPEQASAEVGGQISQRTIYRALTKRAQQVPAGAAPKGLEVANISPDVPPEAVAAAIVEADPEKARALRRLVAGFGAPGDTFDGRTVERLAVTWGCEPADVRALLLEAAILAGKDALPPELAREESIGVARRVRDKAFAAADWKSVLLAQQHIDARQLPKGGAPADGLTRAQVVVLLRRCLAAVAPYPGAAAALRDAIESSSSGEPVEAGG